MVSVPTPRPLALLVDVFESPAPIQQDRVAGAVAVGVLWPRILQVLALLADS